MPEVSATSFARNLSHILDDVEHHGATYTVVRHGRPVARLEGAKRPSLREWAAAIERRGADPDFARDVAAAREGLSQGVRDPWTD